MSCSPQRKRRTSADLELTDDPTASPRASDSPRTTVARRFGALDLHDLSDVPSTTTASDDSQTPRKRRQNPISSSEEERMRLPRSPPVSPAGPVSVQGLGLSLGPAAPLTPSSSPAKRVVVASPSPQRESSPGRRSKGRRLRSPSPKVAREDQEGDLTWQPGEITGYTIDATAPDDSDGLGINGLGFVPSPAEAERRRDRRRKQVLEWRAREARDERRRRVERRSGGRVRDSEQGEASRRVRFGVAAGD